MLPNKPGVWHHIPTNQDIDIYPLEPVFDVLCFWGPDVGISYSGSADTQTIWDSDEWQGHIRPECFDYVPENWEFVSDQYLNI